MMHTSNKPSGGRVPASAPPGAPVQPKRTPSAPLEQGPLRQHPEWATSFGGEPALVITAPTALQALRVLLASLPRAMQCAPSCGVITDERVAGCIGPVRFDVVRQDSLTRHETMDDSRPEVQA